MHALCWWWASRSLTCAFTNRGGSCYGTVMFLLLLVPLIGKVGGNMDWVSGTAFSPQSLKVATALVVPVHWLRELQDGQSAQPGNLVASIIAPCDGNHPVQDFGTAMVFGVFLRFFREYVSFLVDCGYKRGRNFYSATSGICMAAFSCCWFCWSPLEEIQKARGGAHGRCRWLSWAPMKCWITVTSQAHLQTVWKLW